MNGRKAWPGLVLAVAAIALSMGSAKPAAAQTDPAERHQEDAPARHHFFVAVDNDN